MFLTLKLRLSLLLPPALLLMGASGCASAYIQTLGGDTTQIFTRIYITDFDTAWQSVLDGLKHNRLDVSNREAGFIQTRWTDNTEDKNFTESFAGQDVYLKAQYRFKLTVSKGFYAGKPSVKVTVQRDQLIQRDVLEGWKAVETDSIEENTLLYRIGRLIYIRMKIARLEDEKTKKALETPSL
jgi:hypothetical protein